MIRNAILFIKRTLQTQAPTMKKNAKKQTPRKALAPIEECVQSHNFTKEESGHLQSNLLKWYDENKRDLPWRTKALEEDLNIRGYAVWVSEIMLQQTQVATVIDYYNRWMTKWPTLKDLAKASLEEVNEMWSGLGYYSRGRRLHEGANKIVKELDGEMPKDAESLLKQLPGVGKYTAGAIASIAYGQVTGLVDGNVIRVFSRMRLIGADSTSQPVTEALWSIANNVVDSTRPGDFNQALMELGATVCTPKAPSCDSCPVKVFCKSYQKVQIEKEKSAAKHVTKDSKQNEATKPLDIECAADNCKLCLPEDEQWDKSLGVMNFPRKPKKKAPREERTAVCILIKDKEFLITQRPDTGLLAGLWEFPNVQVDLETSVKKCPAKIREFLQNQFNFESDENMEFNFISEVVHIFSHIHQTYMVYAVEINAKNGFENGECDKAMKWVTKEVFLDAAISTAMKKVFKAYEAAANPKGQKRKKGVSDRAQKPDKKRQLGLEAFFKPSAK